MPLSTVLKIPLAYLLPRYNLTQKGLKTNMTSNLQEKFALRRKLTEFAVMVACSLCDVVVMDNSLH